ncbi:hypothetical protein ACFX2H_022776 [Malus domestica]
MSNKNTASPQGSSQQRRLPASLPPPKQEPIPGSSALAITNRFTPLGSTLGSIRPNYQTALVNQYDPFSSTYRQSPSPSVSYTKTSPYIIKPSKEYLFSIPFNFKHLKTPEVIAKKMFPTNSHFQPSEFHKTLKYYTTILNETSSITIKPILDKTSGNQNRILYHSLTINKFLLESEWQVPLFQPKPFKSSSFPSHSNHYTYFDYIQAWTNIFLHQSEDFSHSWFITFDRSFRLNFPAWFPRWWAEHGLISDLMPDEFKKVLSGTFQKKFDRKRFDEGIPLFALFMAKYKIPWILRWNYEIESNQVFRQRMIKWWDKFNYQKIIEVVLKDFPMDSDPVPAVAAPPATALLEPTKEEIDSLSDISPSSSLKGQTKSSKSSSSSKKKKSSKLKALAKILMKELQEENEDSSDSDNSSDASSQQAVASQGNIFPPDSQDPYEF